MTATKTSIDWDLTAFKRLHDTLYRDAESGNLPSDTWLDFIDFLEDVAECIGCELEETRPKDKRSKHLMQFSQLQSTATNAPPSPDTSLPTNPPTPASATAFVTGAVTSSFSTASDEINQSSAPDNDVDMADDKAEIDMQDDKDVAMADASDPQNPDEDSDVADILMTDAGDEKDDEDMADAPDVSPPV